MIAIFYHNPRALDDARYYPSDLFLPIRSVNDIRGRKFTGVIFLCRIFSLSKNAFEALEALQDRQPKLFI